MSATDTIETPEDVAAVITQAAAFVPKEKIVACTNCGMPPMRRKHTTRNCKRRAGRGAGARRSALNARKN